MQHRSDYFLGFEEYSSLLLDSIFLRTIEHSSSSCGVLHSSLRIAPRRSVHCNGCEARLSFGFARAGANHGHRRWPCHVVYVDNGIDNQTYSI